MSEPARVVAISRYQSVFWLIALCALVADQASKAAILHTLARHTPLPLLPGLFELRLEFNSGAAFSLFPGGRWIFVAVSATALVFLPIYLRGLLRAGERPLVCTLGAGLILGGALGNALDRIFREQGLVVDFFHAHWGKHSFPVFNLADSAITIGLGLLLFVMFFPGHQAALAANTEEPGEQDVANAIEDR